MTTAVSCKTTHWKANKWIKCCLRSIMWSQFLPFGNKRKTERIAYANASAIACHYFENIDVREHGAGGDEATNMLQRLQTTLHKYSSARRGPKIKHVVLFAGTNDIPNFLSSMDEITAAVSTLVIKRVVLYKVFMSAVLCTKLSWKQML